MRVWSPTKGLSYGKTTNRPTALSLQEEYCTVTEWEGAFEALLQIQNGNLTMPESVNDAIAGEVASGLAIGARLQHEVGGLQSTYAAVAGSSPELVDQWTKFNAAEHEGYFAGMKRIGGAADQGYFTAANAEGFDFLEFFDSIVAGAPKRLQTAVNIGGLNVNGVNSAARTVMLVSGAVAAAAYRSRNAELRAAATNGQRMTTETVGGLRALVVDQTVIIPIDSFDRIDEITGNTTYAACLTVAGNIGFGLSFGPQFPVPGVNAAPGVLLQQSGDIRYLGMLYLRADPLVSSAFGADDLVAGTVDIIEPAA